MNPYEPPAQTGSDHEDAPEPNDLFGTTTRTVGIALALVTGFFFLRVLFGAALGVYLIIVAFLTSLD